jgi:acetyltransferase-like isoleucine patch superfamily enzyme
MSFELSNITGEWDYRLLPRNVRIGANCFLERREAFDRFRSERDPGLILGDGVQILTWTHFNVEPTGFIEIGDESVIVGAVFMCADSIRIGGACVISYNVTLADSDFHPLDADARRRDAVALSPAGDRSQRSQLVTHPIVIGDRVWIGTGAIILKGVRIGDGATIAAGTVLTRDVPPNAVASGNPAVISDA